MSDFKRRYRAIRNATYDPSLASRAAYWSDENIFERLGIKVPKSVPKLKMMPPVGTTKRKRLESAAKRRLEKFNRAKLEGLTPERAYRYRYETFKRIEQIDASPPPRYLALDDDGPEINFDGLKNKSQRKKQWAEWSQKRGVTYPDWVLAAVEYANGLQNLDLYAKYGWAMVYYAYVDGKELDEVMAMYVVDPYDGDRYVEVMET